MDSTSLFIMILTSSFGMGYFVYGKKQHMAIPLIAGIGLCVYPYFVEGALQLIVVGLALMAAPFFLRF